MSNGRDHTHSGQGLVHTPSHEPDGSTVGGVPVSSEQLLTCFKFESVAYFFFGGGAAAYIFFRICPLHRYMVAGDYVFPLYQEK